MFISQICQNLDELGKGILRSLPHAKEKNTCKFKGNLVEQKRFEPESRPRKVSKIKYLVFRYIPQYR
jgi:hypothetical protein